MDPGKLVLHIAWIMLVSIVWCHIGSDVERVENSEIGAQQHNKTDEAISPQDDKAKNSTEQLQSMQSHLDQPIAEEESAFSFSLVTVAPATPHADDMKSMLESVILSTASAEHSLPLPSRSLPLKLVSIDLNEVDVIKFDSASMQPSHHALSSDIHFLEKCKINDPSESGKSPSLEEKTAEIYEAISAVDKKETESKLDMENVELKPLSDNAAEITVASAGDAAVNDGSEQLQSYLEWVEEREKIEKIARPAVERIPNRKRKLDKKNYASEDCGAKIVSTNAGLSRADSVLNENKDSYMLNECTAEQWWFVVELCQRIQLESIEVGNFELFASSPKQISVYVSDRMASDWQFVKQYDIMADGQIQNFEIDHEVYGKYLKVELHGQQGNEHYCTLSLLRVYGTTEFEMLADDDVTGESPDAADSCSGDSCKDASNSAQSSPVDFLEKAKIAVLSMFGGSSPDHAGANQTVSTVDSSQGNSSIADDSLSASRVNSTEAVRSVSGNVSVPSDILSKDAIVIRYEEEDEEDIVVDNKTLAISNLFAVYSSTISNTTTSFSLLSLPFHCIALQRICCWLSNRVKYKQTSAGLPKDNDPKSSYLLNSQDISKSITANSLEMPNGSALSKEQTTITTSANSEHFSKAGLFESDSKMNSILPISTSKITDSSTVDLPTETHSAGVVINPSMEDTMNAEGIQETRVKLELTNHSSEASAATTETAIPSISSKDIETTKSASVEESSTSSNRWSVSVNGTASSVLTNLEPSFKLVMEVSRASNESEYIRDAREPIKATSATSLEPTASSTISANPVVVESSETLTNQHPTATATSALNGDITATAINGGSVSQGGAKHGAVLPGSKESVLVKLKKKISDLETNLNRSLVYLELMSQKYRKNLDEQQKASERKLVNLSNLLANTSLKMQLLESSHSQLVSELVSQVGSLSSNVMTLNGQAHTLKQEMSLMAQSYTVVMILQAVVMVIVLKRCCGSSHDKVDRMPIRRHSEPHDIQHTVRQEVKNSHSDPMICRHLNGHALQPGLSKRKRHKKHSKAEQELFHDTVFIREKDAKQQESYTSALCSRATVFLSSGKHLVVDRLAGRLFTSIPSATARSRLPISRRSRPLRRFSSMERGVPDEMAPQAAKRPRSCEPVEVKFRSRKRADGRSI